MAKRENESEKPSSGAVTILAVEVFRALLGFIRVYSGLLGFEGLGFDLGVWGV